MSEIRMTVVATPTRSRRIGREGSGGSVSDRHAFGVAAPVAGDRATPERCGKGQDLVVREDVQRVASGLTTLGAAGDVSAEQATAAERWYRDYVMGVVGARDPEGKRSGRAPDLHASMLARTAAVGRCRFVREALGLCGEVRLKLLLVEELSFSAIASVLLPNDSNGRKKVAAQFLLLLEQLSEIYAHLDRSKGMINKHA
ncbi:MAG: hypothetical protein INR65_01970 [Gluconacetobacter diazotrophicus]|nr:hypothetical protein [Gluconacetobacter diazotrophicus]